MGCNVGGIACYFVPILVSLLLIRAAYVWCLTGKARRRADSQSVKTLIVLGSGGHTAEMLSIVNVIQKDRFAPRLYVAAATDNMSLQKARVLEDSLVQHGKIICNGPGTCIPLCVSAFLFKILGVKWSYIFYVESIARVRRLSLSGLLLYKLRMADQFVVQWPQLQTKYPRALYEGRLM